MFYIASEGGGGVGGGGGERGYYSKRKDFSSYGKVVMYCPLEQIPF